MFYLLRPVAIAATACGLLAIAAPAQAASNQTWVAANGAPGACSIAAPCNTFLLAYGQTNPGGVINVLTSGDYGPLTIAKSISIVSDGAVAAIYSATGGAAITINGAGIEVSLRGLTIDLFGSSANLGISFIKGQALHIAHSTIRGAGNGVRFAPNTTGISELYVSDTLITKGPGDGLAVAPVGNAYAKVMIERVRVENTGSDGFMFDGTSGAINATIRDSVASGNAASGITATGNAGHPLNVMLNRAASINNGNTGIVANGAQIRMGDSTVSGNNLGLFTVSGGSMLTYGNNQVNGNFGGGDGTTTGGVLFK